MEEEPRSIEGEKFLHKKDQKLHISTFVEHEQERRKKKR